MMFFLPPALVTEAQPAPASINLDLSSALARARADNPLLKVARARVEERAGLITMVRADAFPQLNAVGDLTRIRDVSILNSGFADSAAKFGINPSMLVGARSMYTTSATIAQPLYYFGKINTAVTIAKMGEKEAMAAQTATELDVLHGVAKAYLNVLATKAELEVVETRKKTAEQFRSDVKAKLEAQAATELDRLRAESEYLAVVPESLQAEANHKRALELLNGALGLDPKTPLSLADMGMPTIPESLEGQERSEITQLKLQEQMLQSNDKILRSDLLPKLDLFASAGYQAGKTDNLFKEPYDTWRVSVTLKVPIFDGLRASGKRAQNRAQLEQNRQFRVDKERAVSVERHSAERELKKAKAFHEAAKQAHDMGLEALRVSRESFDQGLITSLDLLQAERTERQLESQRRRAELGVWAAYFDYRRALNLLPM